MGLKNIQEYLRASTKHTFGAYLKLEGENSFTYWDRGQLSKGKHDCENEGNTVTSVLKPQV